MPVLSYQCWILDSSLRCGTQVVSVAISSVAGAGCRSNRVNACRVCAAVTVAVFPADSPSFQSQKLQRHHRLMSPCGASQLGSEPRNNSDPHRRCPLRKTPLRSAAGVGRGSAGLRRLAPGVAQCVIPSHLDFQRLLFPVKQSSTAPKVTPAGYGPGHRHAGTEPRACGLAPQASPRAATPQTRTNGVARHVQK